MSYADIVFKETCRNIIENGYSDEALEVRPHWEDGAPAHTIKQFGVVNRYDLSKEFPIMTLRKVYFRSCIDEILWIWQKKSNDVHELHSHIWDSWADESWQVEKVDEFTYTFSQTADGQGSATITGGNGLQEGFEILGTVDSDGGLLLKQEGDGFFGEGKAQVSVRSYL